MPMARYSQSVSKRARYKGHRYRVVRGRPHKCRLAMREERFDMVVVGAGPAGEKAAAQAAYFGKKVAIVEQAPALGGAMAASAVTTKAMREAALYLTGFQRRHVYGAGIDLHPQAVIDRLRARAVDVSESMSQAVEQNLTRHGIELVTGRARLGPDRTVLVTVASGNSTRTLAAGVVLIAPGSRPFHPPGIPFDDPDVLDSETARGLDRPMRSLVVVGGGAVACEYAVDLHGAWCRGDIGRSRKSVASFPRRRVFSRYGRLLQGLRHEDIPRNRGGGDDPRC